MARSVTLLPEPDSPDDAEHFAGIEREVDAIDRMDRALSADKANRQVLAA